MVDSEASISQAQPHFRQAATERLTKELPMTYQDSDMVKMLNRQRDRDWLPTALVSDFDNSYFRPDRKADTDRLAAVAARNDIPIVIVTGNDAQGLIKRIGEIDLKKPQVIIGAVGTEIWVLHTDDKGRETYIKDDMFDAKLKSLNYDRKAAAQRAVELIDDWQKPESPNSKWRLDFQKPEIERAFVTGQPAEVQPYKLSFYFYADDGERGQAEEAIRAQFPGLEIAVCEEIGYNSKIQPGDKKKFCVDCLPIVPKAGAVNEVLDLVGVDRAMNVGDSGNDITLLTKTTRGEGIIVGGSKPELPAQVLKNATPLRASGFLKVGPERRKYYQATSEATAAGGILEAAIRRMQVMMRLEPNEPYRRQIAQIIADLQS